MLTSYLWFITIANSVVFGSKITFLLEKQFFEGDSCLTKDFKNGLCLKLEECTEFISEVKAIKGSSFDVNKDLFHCEFSVGISVICCVTKLSNKISDFSLKTLKRKAEVACERIESIKAKLCHTIEDHVIDGENVKLNEFPHMAAIAISNDCEMSEDYEFACGGSLISDRFILTAAHCINIKNRPPLFARLGKTSLNQEDDLTGIDVKIKTIISHEKFTSRKKYNDVALLELIRSVSSDYSHSLLPACLHTGQNAINDLIVSGWGRSDLQKNSGPENWMQKAKMVALSTEECEQYYKNFSLQSKVQIRSTQVCALGQNSADTCQGDSGAPIQFIKSNKFYIVGVSSFGVGCGSSLPGIYTRVSAFIEWIEEKVWN